jgi:vesicle coat complex subunit
MKISQHYVKSFPLPWVHQHPTIKLTLIVTLLSKPPELQFVALRNAQLILEKRPEILRNDIKVFFCKYNDPIYVKLAKLEVIVKLATETNIVKVLEELKEYVSLASFH